MNLPFKLLFGMANNSSLYDFQTFTFTNAGATGMYGPSLAQCINAYNASSWISSDNFNVSGGIQIWTVPQSGTYEFIVCGAKGGGTKGGNGARMQGEFLLSVGESLLILVGQMGRSHNGNSSGGGGGTFVARSNMSPLIVAGGGAGGINRHSGDDGVITQNSSKGRNLGLGMGGRIYKYDELDKSHGSGGAGFYGDGEIGATGIRAKSFINGGIGATGFDTAGGGGFGGGGGYHNSGSNVGGGGGGYTGGHANWGFDTHRAGGGGSFNSGINQNNRAGINATHGYVKITFLR